MLARKAQCDDRVIMVSGAVGFAVGLVITDVKVLCKGGSAHHDDKC